MYAITRPTISRFHYRPEHFSAHHFVQFCYDSNVFNMAIRYISPKKMLRRTQADNTAAVKLRKIGAHMDTSFKLDTALNFNCK